MIGYRKDEIGCYIEGLFNEEAVKNRWASSVNSDKSALKLVVELKPGESLDERVGRLYPEHTGFLILRKSIDARKKRSRPVLRYDLQVLFRNEVVKPKVTPLAEIQPLDRKSDKIDDRILIVGTGPAGLFAALQAVELGLKVTLIEKGSRSEQRIKGINRFWRYGEIDSDNNVCIGEGGAGLYSDGKLITRIKSPHIDYVLQRLVDFGAPGEIVYSSNPHIGSDKIRRLIPKIRNYLEGHGVEILFDDAVTDFITGSNIFKGVVLKSGRRIEADHTVLATGHSAEDIYESCLKHRIHAEVKDFALGLRIEHSQDLINKIQHGVDGGHEDLGPANYRFAITDPQTQIGVYSFCMCPGGYVLSSGTEHGRLVSNGMSNFNRNSKWANAAVVVTTRGLSSSRDLIAGLDLRRQIEERAFEAVVRAGGSKELPAQRVTDFLLGKLSSDLPKTSCPSGVVSVRLDLVLPEETTSSLRKTLRSLNQRMPGFVSEDALFVGVETRTSSPLRITRDKSTLQSLSHRGLYPTGEGAGYAGGITSAACDGIRVMLEIGRKLTNSLATSSQLI